MERYLSLENLQLALGENYSELELPTPEELQSLIGEAEVMMFTKQSVVPDRLLTIGWFLHSVASNREGLEVYSVERRKRAHQVASHIFDLALQRGVDDRAERMSYIFAAQIGYIKGDLTPNAIAIYKNYSDKSKIDYITDYNLTALDLGIKLLALDRASLFEEIIKFRQHTESIEFSEDNNLKPVIAVVNSVWNMLLYLTYGYEQARERASLILEEIVRNPNTSGDLDSRWVAAHLIDLNVDLSSNSLWSIVPPEIPRNSIKAMTLGSPPILSLWPPQARLLGESNNNSPLLLQTRRLMLSVPTSAGKTLLSQLFILSHLSQGGKGVCFVAPSHSLCREIQDSLSARLRFMNYNVANSLPENFEDFGEKIADIEVMTPERFNYLLRHDVKRMLSDYSLFIIDEAHLIGEQGRGLGLETSLSVLNMLTKDSSHRIFLMSAAIGKEGHLHEWLTLDSGSRSFHSDWRGPRRLYAMYSSEINNDIRAETLPPTSRRKIALTKLMMRGVVRLRIADTHQIHKVSLIKPVGELYLKPLGVPKRVHVMSTRQNRMLVPLILSVSESGPVLIIESTRSFAQDMAKYISEAIVEEKPKTYEIAEFVKLRLGEQHSLAKIIKKGVAYHHAALPADVQDAIESGVKEGVVDYIISTTTLVDGINLPVRTVVLSHLGVFRNNGEFEETIKGPKLINAIGRAGRAAKESEGWIILSGKYDAEKLSSLMQVKDEDLIIHSELTSIRALEELAAFEILLLTAEDAVFEVANTKVSSFISYIWFVFSAIEEINEKITVADLENYLSSTLAWKQLSADNKGRWSSVAKQALIKYSSTDTETRKRWSKTGTSISTSRKLEILSRQLFDNILGTLITEDRYLDSQEMIELILSDENLSLMFSYPESPKVEFKSRRNAPDLDSIEVNIKKLLRDWIDGNDLSTMVDDHLSEINNTEFAFESLGVFITSVFENYLPWVVGTIIRWINDYPQAFSEGRNLVNPNLSAYIKYGVNDANSVRLMTRGIRSRRLALRLSKDFELYSDLGFELNSWLDTLTVDGLVNDYNASKSEISDFIKYLNLDATSFLPDLIEQQNSSINLYGLESRTSENANFKVQLTENGNRTIFITDDQGILFELPLSFHRDVSSLINTGLPYVLKVESEDGITRLNASFIDFSNSIF